MRKNGHIVYIIVPIYYINYRNNENQLLTHFFPMFPNGNITFKNENILNKAMKIKYFFCFKSLKVILCSTSFLSKSCNN